MNKSEQYVLRSEQAAAEIATWPKWMQRNLKPPTERINMTDFIETQEKIGRVQEEEVPKPVQFRHNWMYSFLPAEDEFYLLGYCKNCTRGLSVLVPHYGKMLNRVRISDLDIPKWGCQELQAL